MMGSIVLSGIGFCLVIMGVVLWTASRQLRRLRPRVQSELVQVPVIDGRLSPRPDIASSGLLRSGPVMRKDGTVVTAYVLSDDAIRSAR
jgi:hypothetical protein